MSEHSTPEERTELPTDRRLGDLRKKGAIHHSHEAVQVASLITGFMVMGYLWQSINLNLQIVLKKSFLLIGEREPLSIDELQKGFLGLLYLLGPSILTLVVVISSVAFLSTMLQTGWNIKEKKIDFDFSQLNPINGIKRVFSLNGAVNLLKALFKLALILPIAFFALKAYAPEMVSLVHMGIGEIFNFTGRAMNSLFWKVLYILIAMAIFDFMYGKWQWLKKNKMTKDEVKDERKAIEGDESTKRKIINKGMARIMQRLTKTVPKADVVVTNPTHYSVALQYDRKKMGAPIVVAKGQGFIALKIREIAKQSGVPVLERKPLARALYASVEVGHEIPRDLFKAVAEVLAYVYRLKNPYQHMQKNQ